MITASIVFYSTNLSLSQKIEYRKVITCSIKSLIDIVYIVDNSPTDSLKEIINEIKSKKIIYIQGQGNIGFGEGHNTAINLAMKSGSNYHFVINPDTSFEPDTVEQMILFSESNSSIGLIMPKVLYPNGKIQYLPKLLPSPISIILRKLNSFGLFNKFTTQYELRNFSEKTFNTPILSGCFTLMNMAAIKEVGNYDKRFFMYFEDFDLSRRIHNKYKTIYYPEVFVYHAYERGANKNLKLLKIFITSAIKYFNKWGWFFDRNRKKINKQTLDALNY